MATVVIMFLKAVVRNNGIPFSLEMPNKKTINSFKEAEDISFSKKLF